MTKNKIAVITPYCTENILMLEKCHSSVLRQGANTKHFLISDGHSKNEIDSWDCVHIKLPVQNNDNGNTPRGIGAVLAEKLDYDYIAYLDADNWYHDGHLDSLVNLITNNSADIGCSQRTFHDLHGQQIGAIDADEKVNKHVDTSCYLVSKSAFLTNYVWLKMPKELSEICDRIFFKWIINQRYKLVYSGQQTVAFRSQYASHYRQAGLVPPKDAKNLVG